MKVSLFILVVILLLLSLVTLNISLVIGVPLLLMTLLCAVIFVVESFKDSRKEPKVPHINKENLKRLIDIISDEENEFEWYDPRCCLGHYANRLLNLCDYGDSRDAFSLARLLEIKPGEALNLYNVTSLDGSKLLETSDDYKPSKERAIEYLSSLL